MFLELTRFLADVSQIIKIFTDLDRNNTHDTQHTTQFLKTREKPSPKGDALHRHGHQWGGRGGT